LIPIKAFTLADAELASKTWGCNCGPTALAACLDVSLPVVRGLMPGFEDKGYTNPTLMIDALKRARVKLAMAYRADEPGKSLPVLKNGLVRIQWGGPWTKPGVPMRVRYRHTHWIAVRDYGAARFVFDINTMGFCESDPHWCSVVAWAGRIVPYILDGCEPKADGSWWPTHGIEVVQG
jgi:hypothetical protein